METSMSRSHRKTPITGITTATSDKDFKWREHQRARAITREALSAGNENTLHRRQTGNPWKSRKDGKWWFERGEFPELAYPSK
jgi:hypothetical protein